ncbi:hypothetical protein JB92DRAFT_2191877 [Gautieria morchelliformis]|nr:hypothetical protein JB92DRAFT_2191877 [Gautieria morchelliformis]
MDFYRSTQPGPQAGSSCERRCSQFRPSFPSQNVIRLPRWTFQLYLHTLTLVKFQYTNHHMSSQQSVDIRVISDSYVNIATLALFAYDTLLTLPSEITYIWRRRVRLGTVLYLLARYPAFLSLLLRYTKIQQTYHSSVCNPLFYLQDCLSIVILPGIEGLLWARVYAMSQHNQGMQWVLGAVGIFCIWAVWVRECFSQSKGMQCHRSGSGCSTFVTETINDMFIILFDTLVVVVTLYNTLGLVRRSREFQMLPRKSLTQTLAEQSLIRYGFVLTITLACVITTKVLRPSIAGILSIVQDSLSTIIICRCHLALQERVAHPNGTTHSAHHPVTSFRAAARQIHNSLMDEFGDPSIEEIGTSEAIEPHRENDLSSNAVVGIELEEIHRGRELGNAVGISSGEVCAEPQSVVVSTGEVSIRV